MTTTQPPPSDQRHFSRVPFHAQVRLIGEDGVAMAPLWDVSLKGALAGVPEGWQMRPGAELTLELALGGDSAAGVVPLQEPAAGVQRIQMYCRVAHVRGDRVGLQCLHIDLDSITQLRRLVVMNLGDASLLDRELAALL